MRVVLRLCLAAWFLTAGLLIPAAPVAQAQAAGSECAPDGTQPSGAVYRFCMPTGTWNGDLVVYAHGYVAFNEPIAIPEDQLSVGEGPSVPEIVNGLGYAFATSSYRINGLAIREGIEDLLELVDLFRATHGNPNRVYLAGPSAGGAITALAMERYPDVFAGGLAACGPVGNFRAQINYWGDARVLFDYFFPGILPGTAISIPLEVIDNWETHYEPLIESQFRAHPLRRQEFMSVANIPGNPFDLEDTIEQLMQLMWYTAFGTNDGNEKLGGQPFDNTQRWYRGSSNDVLLNLSVPRYSADPAAVAEMESHYQTTGKLSTPIVMLHAVDPLIPLWHEPLYTRSVYEQGSQALHTSLPALRRYGHCDFTVAQVLVAFVVMVRQVTGTTIADAERVLITPAQQQEYREWMQTLPMVEEEARQIAVPGGTLYLPLLTE